MWIPVPKSWRAPHPGEETSAELCGVSSPEAHPVLCPRWAPCCAGHLGVIPAQGCSTRGTRIPAFNCVVLGVWGGGTNWVSDVCLTAPRDPHLQPSLPLMLSSTFRGPQHPWVGLSHSSGVSSQAPITLDHVECFADPGWASAPRARVPSHQGHFCSGPHLARQPTQTHAWGLIRGWKWGQSSPQQKSPLAWKPRSALHPRVVHAFGWKAGAL